MFNEPAKFARRLLRWYDRNRRDLPWRVPIGTRPDPYHILLSETMLQQTQVAMMLPYFREFLSKYPTLAHLAAADEQAVLRSWQGLGYYSRARNLLATAQRIVADRGGDIPQSVELLLALPGIGRYTAGAVASIAFDTKAPIVDTNVARVLMRIDCIRSDLKDRETQLRLWESAEAILPNRRSGDFNSALMELGATICTPRLPQCLICPVRAHCEAFAAGLQDQIPLPKKAKPTPLFQRNVFCIASKRDEKTIWLIQQRPPRGRWAGMWQFITFDPGESKDLAKQCEAACGLKCRSFQHLGKIAHALTHRRYQFDIYLCAKAKPISLRSEMRWAFSEELTNYPMPRPHVRIAEMLTHLIEK